MCSQTIRIMLYTVEDLEILPCERENIMNKIQKLRNSIKKKCSFEDYEHVNKCINEIISDKREGDDIKEIKALICQIESILNKSNSNSILALSYAILMGVIAILSNISILNKDIVLTLMVSLFLIVATFFLTLSAWTTQKKDYKDTFVLKVLNFKLEELNNKKIGENDSSREYIVRINER